MNQHENLGPMVNPTTLEPTVDDCVSFYPDAALTGLAENDTVPHAPPAANTNMMDSWLSDVDVTAPKQRKRRSSSPTKQATKKPRTEPKRPEKERHRDYRNKKARELAELQQQHAAFEQKMKQIEADKQAESVKYQEMQRENQLLRAQIDFLLNCLLKSQGVVVYMNSNQDKVSSNENTHM